MSDQTGSFIFVDQPAMVNQFTTTEPLSHSNNPSDGIQWPSWAVIAFIHKLGDDHPDGEPDLYVTYVSDANMMSGETDRRMVCGVQVEVVELYFWDWGPQTAPPDATFISNDGGIFAPAPLICL